jgi:hypothetical protein
MINTSSSSQPRACISSRFVGKKAEPGKSVRRPPERRKGTIAMDLRSVVLRPQSAF